MTASDAAQLHSALAATRASAERGDPDGALDQLRKFDSEVRALAAKERLTPADVHALRVGARQARAAVVRGAQPATTPTPTPTVAAPTPPAPAKPHEKPAGPKKQPKDKHGKGHG